MGDLPSLAFAPAGSNEPQTLDTRHRHESLPKLAASCSWAQRQRSSTDSQTLGRRHVGSLGPDARITTPRREPSAVGRVGHWISPLSANEHSHPLWLKALCISRVGVCHITDTGLTCRSIQELTEKRYRAIRLSARCNFKKLRNTGGMTSILRPLPRVYSTVRCIGRNFIYHRL